MKRILALILAFLLPLTAFADLEARFIDVGHGDCTIIICDGEAMIIDGGESGESDRVFTAIHDLSITELKYAVATHPQSDHVGGLPAAFHAANVRALYSPVTEYDNERFRTLMDKAKEMAVPVFVPVAGDVLTLGNATVTVLAPVKQYKDPNDISIVLRIDYGQHSFLLCADAGVAVEKTLLKAGTNVDADVLKVAHHGSNSATSPEFAQAISPRYSIISCSARYDNPDREVLDALYNVPRCDVLRTDINGDVVIVSDGETLSVVSEYYYVGNGNSEIFHRMTCSSVSKMKDSNKVTLYTPEQAEYEGYRPCKNCSP